MTLKTKGFKKYTGTMANFKKKCKTHFMDPNDFEYEKVGTDDKRNPIYNFKLKGYEEETMKGIDVGKAYKEYTLIKLAREAGIDYRTLELSPKDAEGFVVLLSDKHKMLEEELPNGELHPAELKRRMDKLGTNETKATEEYVRAMAKIEAGEHITPDDILQRDLDRSLPDYPKRVVDMKYKDRINAIRLLLKSKPKKKIEPPKVKAGLIKSIMIDINDKAKVDHFDIEVLGGIYTTFDETARDIEDAVNVMIKYGTDTKEAITTALLVGYYYDLNLSSAKIGKVKQLLESR